MTCLQLQTMEAKSASDLSERDTMITDLERVRRRRRRCRRVIGPRFECSCLFTAKQGNPSPVDGPTETYRQTQRHEFQM